MYCGRLDSAAHSKIPYGGFGFKRPLLPEPAAEECWLKGTRLCPCASLPHTEIRRNAQHRVWSQIPAISRIVPSPFLPRRFSSPPDLPVLRLDPPDSVPRPDFRHTRPGWSQRVPSPSPLCFCRYTAGTWGFDARFPNLPASRPRSPGSTPVRRDTQPRGRRRRLYPRFLHQVSHPPFDVRLIARSDEQSTRPILHRLAHHGYWLHHTAYP